MKLILEATDGLISGQFIVDPTNGTVEIATKRDGSVIWDSVITIIPDSDIVSFAAALLASKGKA